MMSVIKGVLLKGEEVHKALMPGWEGTKDAHSRPNRAVNGTVSGAVVKPRKSRQDKESRKETGTCSHFSLNLWELI